MNFAVLTIFPEMFDAFWKHGIIRRSIEGELIQVEAVDIRVFAEDRHKTTDDRPYGGGCGMVMKPEPLAGAIRWSREKYPHARTILLSPQGRVFDQRQAERLAWTEGMILVCGRYEGVDERICTGCIDEEISIGDYVLTGGELGAMVIIEAVTRLLPGALGGAESAEKDSFTTGLLEHAHYTRPPVFQGESAPEVLLSGNHQAIEIWRQEASLIRTFLKRPDLLMQRQLSSQEIKILRKWCLDIGKIIDSQSLCSADALSGGQ